MSSTAHGNPPFALLLFGTTALDFYLGGRIAAARGQHARKAWLVASVTSNLSMLGFFKYGNFFLENTRWLLAQVGVGYNPPHLGIFLPIGISFYTFHSLSYTLDVYRGVCAPTRSLRDFALAVSFFPQLVAGPIVRAADFLPQLVSAPKLRPNQFGWGLLLMTLGMFEKMVLADTLLASSADAVFGYPGPLKALDAWTGVLAFSGQIFFDFAGYSTCAIGAALCLGFNLKDNFRFPYAAVGFSDFLAQVASSPLHLPARLPLHPVGGQPPGPRTGGGQSADRDVYRRTLARRGVDLRHLGPDPRRLPDDRADIQGRHRRRGLQPHSREGEASPWARHLRGRLLRMGLLPRLDVLGRGQAS